MFFSFSVYRKLIFGRVMVLYIYHIYLGHTSVFINKPTVVIIIKVLEMFLQINGYLLTEMLVVGSTWATSLCGYVLEKYSIESKQKYSSPMVPTLTFLTKPPWDGDMPLPFRHRISQVFWGRAFHTHSTTEVPHNTEYKYVNKLYAVVSKQNKYT